MQQLHCSGVLTKVECKRRFIPIYLGLHCTLQKIFLWDLIVEIFVTHIKPGIQHQFFFFCFVLFFWGGGGKTLNMLSVLTTLINYRKIPFFFLMSLEVGRGKLGNKTKFGPFGRYLYRVPLASGSPLSVCALSNAHVHAYTVFLVAIFPFARHTLTSGRPSDCQVTRGHMYKFCKILDCQ